jgi:hypothetical protein
MENEMTLDYLQRILDNPATPREQYMWAWNIMQERIAQTHRVQAEAAAFHN